MKDAANDSEHGENCHLHLRKKSLFSTKVLCRRLSEKEKSKDENIMNMNKSFKIKCFISIRHNCAICKLTRG